MRFNDLAKRRRVQVDNWRYQVDVIHTKAFDPELHTCFFAECKCLVERGVQATKARTVYAVPLFIAELPGIRLFQA